MLETALKLSDSRLLLFGAVAVDTMGMGALAVLLTTPGAASSSAMLLISLAVTTPVLALTVGAAAICVPKAFGTDERARRAILAGTVLHMAVQANAILPMLCACGRGPGNLPGYVLHTSTTAAILAVLIIAAALLITAWRSHFRKAPMQAAIRAPDSEL